MSIFKSTVAWLLIFLSQIVISNYEILKPYKHPKMKRDAQQNCSLLLKKGCILVFKLRKFQNFWKDATTKITYEFNIGEKKTHFFWKSPYRWITNSEIMKCGDAMAESAWNIPYLNRKIFLFCYHIFKSYFFLSLTFPISLSDFYLIAL